MAFLQRIPGKIDGAVIAIGANDSINGTGTTAGQYARNLRGIVTTLRQSNPGVLIAVQDEINTKPGESAKPLPQTLIRNVEESLASTMHLDYISIAAKWGSEMQADRRGYMAGDGVHPTDLGGKEIANLMLHYLLSLPSSDGSVE
jgi:lysophospholipase L1-like esterase